MTTRQYATADAETDPFHIGRVPKPFLWGFYDGTIYKEFSTTKEFVNYVKELKIIIYAHNGGKFDWHFLKEYIEPLQKMMVINGRIASFKIGECEFRDSVNLLPVKLSAYQKTEIDYKIFEADERIKPKNKKLISDYLKDDCIFLYDLVDTFIKDYGLNLTLAGSAMKFWRKNFYTGKPIKSSKFFFDSLRQYYYGGRVECFVKGIIEKPFKLHDINSAYSTAMQHNHCWGTDYDILEELPKHYKQCFIEISCISNGAFPFKDKSASSYPSDNIVRTYKITGWELFTARKYNLLKEEKIIQVIQFKKIITFKDYIDHFYKLKASYKGNDKARYLIAKFFLNTLYGKFASNPLKYKEYWTVPLKAVEAYQNNTDFVLTAELSEETAIMEQPLPEEQHNYYNVATAASVTGYVRAYLLEYMQKVGNVLYCDTDSIIHHGDSKVFPISEKLGDWDLEGDFVRGAIAGKKLYSFIYKDGKSKNASKGVNLSSKDIFRVASGETVCYNSSVPTFKIKGGASFLSRNIKIT